MPAALPHKKAIANRIRKMIRDGVAMKDIMVSIHKSELTWQPMVLVALSILVAIVKTERAISENFTEEGKKK